VAYEAFKTNKLVSDARVAYMFVNEGRYRALERMFGVSRRDANLLTFVLVGMTLEGTHQRVTAVQNAEGPTAGDMFIMAGFANELLHQLLGPDSRDIPALGPLVILALIGAAGRPLVRRSGRWLGTAGHDIRASFNRRYGRQIR
jgi:hypothetical protein